MRVLYQFRFPIVKGCEILLSIESPLFDNCPSEMLYFPKRKEVHMSADIVLVLELIGTVAFSVSGAITGLKKKMDILGVVILGLPTAVGGGVIRDLILGITPPNTFRNPIYATFAIVTAIIVFLPAMQNLIMKKKSIYNQVMLIMDSLGLGIFTVVGIQVAQSASGEHGIFLLVFVGVVTGVGGGVLRDTMAGEHPYIFVKHFYACASLIGALVCVFAWDIIGEANAMLAGTAVVVILRLLAAHFRWSLPKPRG